MSIEIGQLLGLGAVRILQLIGHSEVWYGQDCSSQMLISRCEVDAHVRNGTLCKCCATRTHMSRLYTVFEHEVISQHL